MAQELPAPTRVLAGTELCGTYARVALLIVAKLGKPLRIRVQKHEEKQAALCEQLGL